MKKRAAFFDLDGTLTSPQEAITGCYRFTLEQLGCSWDHADDLCWCIGPPLRENFIRLLGTNEQSRVERAVDIYREEQSKRIAGNAPYPGIPEMLAAVAARDYQMFVVTSKLGSLARDIVQYFSLSRFFHGIHGAERDGTRSEKHELIAYVLATYRLEPGHAVMIGDREHDIRGAVKCGVRSIGVTYGFGSEAELQSNGATYIAASPEEIPDLVERVWER